MAMTIEQFGATVKAKYPQYSGYSNAEIGQRMLDKYPQYRSQVTVPQEPGVVQSAVQSIAKPILRFGTSVADLVARTGEATGLIEKGTSAQLEKNGANLGYLGQVKPFGQATFDKQGVRNMLSAAGTGAEAASYLVPAAGAAKLIKPTLSGLIRTGFVTGAKTGLVSGAAAGFGSGLQDAEDPSLSLTDVAKNTAIKTAAGGAAGTIGGG